MLKCCYDEINHQLITSWQVSVSSKDFFFSDNFLNGLHYASFFKLGFTPCKAEQPLRGMELQEKEAKKIKAYMKYV